MINTETFRLHVEVQSFSFNNREIVQEEPGRHSTKPSSYISRTPHLRFMETLIKCVWEEEDPQFVQPINKTFVFGSAVVRTTAAHRWHYFSGCRCSLNLQKNMLL